MSRTMTELRLANNLRRIRTVRAIRFVELALLFNLLFPIPSYAILVGAGRFDQLIQNAEIVVKARVTRIEEPMFERCAFEAEVVAVLKSDGGSIANQLFLKPAFPVWPKELGVPFAEKQMVLMILSRENDKLAVVNHMGAILPAMNSKIHHENRSSVTRKVFDELRAFLPQAKDELAKGLVLVHLSQLASKEDENMFLPYMESTDEWLQRAALASLIRINPTPERIGVAVGDFGKHLSNPSKDLFFWKMYQDVRWASRCSTFGMEKNITMRARVYLPIYRALIDKAPPDYQRVYVAIEALKNVGTREDICRLYKHLDHEKAGIRHDVIEGLGRILGMKIKRPLIPAYEIPENLHPDVKAWEKRMRSTIEKTLASNNILCE